MQTLSCNINGESSTAISKPGVISGASMSTNDNSNFLQPNSKFH